MGVARRLRAAEATMKVGPIAADPRAAEEALRRFASAYVFLLVGLAALSAFSGRLAQGQLLDGGVVAAVHVLTLGWLSLSIFAALRVFGGVALGSGLASGALGTVQWLSWLLGSLVFPLGLVLGSSLAIVLGMGALTVGVAAFTWVAVPAYARATRGRLTRAYLVVALLSLWIVLWLGVTAGLRRTGVLPWGLPAGYFEAHVLVAVFGWAGATVVGVGSHLLPMFALSREPREWPIRVAFPVFASVPVWGLLGSFVPAPYLTLGWIAAAVGSALWIVQVALYARTRLRREADPGLALAAGATALLGLAWLLLLLADRPVAFVALLVVGWLTLFTLGIFHRVVPFLVWYRRFSARTGPGRAPRVKDLTDGRVAALTAVGCVSGVLSWTAGLVLGDPGLARAGAALAFASALAGLLQLRTLMRRPASPKAVPTMEVAS
jgi:hypothetical protein